MTRPYRVPVPPEPAPEAVADPTTVDDLGPLRSRHTMPPLFQQLRDPFVYVMGFAIVAFAAILVLFVHAPARWVAFVVPPAFLALAWRRNKLAVDLHFKGLVVRSATAALPVLYDDVDEVWLEQARADEPVALHLVTRGTRVTRARDRITIPASLPDFSTVASAVDRACTEPLRNEAFAALARGERLTFGDFVVDSAGIDAPAWSIRWSELALVRIAAGQIELLTGEALVAVRVHVGDVPHARLFGALVAKLAPKIEGEGFARFGGEG